ncbi:MAG TPA: aminotransferase class IV [Gemmatimonadales bacterium]|nr:aminotransferase class IV [Gemmatimonadales bacterium]
MDHGEHPSPGLIETMRVREGRIPFLERHCARLARSLAALGLPSPSRDVAALVAPFADCGEAVLRVVVEAGRASVTVREVPKLEPPKVITASGIHPGYPHKTTERAAFVSAAEEAIAAGADDALLRSGDGWVTEGTVWNVFWWDGDELRTPSLELGILPGIGRARVLEIGPRAAREGRYRQAALTGRSLFLTNAVRGVVPIAALDGQSVPAHPGTQELMARFWPAPRTS